MKNSLHTPEQCAANLEQTMIAIQLVKYYAEASTAVSLNLEPLRVVARRHAKKIQCITNGGIFDEPSCNS